MRRAGTVRKAAACLSASAPYAAVFSAMPAPSPVHLVHADASFACDADALLADAGSAPVRVVAVLGAQASGKSTLINALYGTSFRVAARVSIGRATTRGIAAVALQPGQAGCASGAPPLLLLDVEGADARDRGRSGTAFQARATAFVASVADVLLLNLWYHDTGRVDSASYGLLRTVLTTSARLIVDGSAAGAEEHVRTALVFVVRDVEEDLMDGVAGGTPSSTPGSRDGGGNFSAPGSPASNDSTNSRDSHCASSPAEELYDMLITDTTRLWDDIAIEEGLPPGAVALHDVFDASVVLLPHIRHHASRFDTAVAQFRDALDADLLPSANSKHVPAEDFAVVAESLWDTLGYGIGGGTACAGGVRGAGAAGGIGGSASDAGDRLGGMLLGTDTAPDDYFAGEDLIIVAAYRCDEVFSSLLAEASGEIADLHDTVGQGTKVSDLGVECERIISTALTRYEVEAAEFASEPVFDRKLRELEAILDSGLSAVFSRQLQILREEAVKSFSASIDGDVPEDFALFTADKAFVKDAKLCQRPGLSHWSFDTERQDLLNMLAAIAAQHRRLLKSELAAAEKQMQAMQFLQIQHAQVRAIQEQAFGGSVGQFNIGAAYRPPDSNCNISLSLQGRKASINVSMVPDSSAHLLGSDGFVSVGPADLGLSFSVNM
jgi:Root hair defective 3 GTP-binding protein (RHD3)